MQVSPPSVTGMVRRLEAEGLVDRGPGKRIVLTAKGARVAKHVVSRHQAVEAFLVKVMGVPWDEVHEEAEAFEMGVTPALEARMLDMIGEARTLPPRPPHRRLPARAGRADRRPGSSVVRILRFENEDHDLLRMFRRAGVEPKERCHHRLRRGPGQAGGTAGRDGAAAVRGQDDLGGGRALRRRSRGRAGPRRAWPPRTSSARPTQDR